MAEMPIRDLVKREISNQKPRKLNGLGNVSERDISLFFLYAYVLPIGGHSAATLRVAADGALRHRAMPVITVILRNRTYFLGNQDNSPTRQLTGTVF